VTIHPPPVAIDPEPVVEPTPRTPERQVIQPTPETPGSPSFATPPTTPTSDILPRRSTRVSRPPVRFYDEF